MNAPLTVGLVGCGAVADLFYGPALAALEAQGVVQVTDLVDPSTERTGRLRERFPRARIAAVRAEDAPAPALAIVGAPPRLHAGLTRQWLNAGSGVLCEKPMATTVADAAAMIAEAERLGRFLAVGHFRRYFPAVEAIGAFLREDTWGPLRSFDVREGGRFDWPSVSPALFDPAQAGGGVFLDLGTHVIDLLVGWLGEPASFDYADDADGGVEANARLRLRYGGDRIAGQVFLSRDWDTAGCWRLNFERAVVGWRPAEADRLEIKPAGSDHWLACALETEQPGGRRPADTYRQSFTRQIADAAAAIAAGRPPKFPAAESLRALAFIERCYAARVPLAQPWNPPAETRLP
jgi:predicted dehydrogenase